MLTSNHTSPDTDKDFETYHTISSHRKYFFINLKILNEDFTVMLGKVHFYVQTKTIRQYECSLVGKYIILTKNPEEYSKTIKYLEKRQAEFHQNINYKAKRLFENWLDTFIQRHTPKTSIDRRIKAYLSSLLIWNHPNIFKFNGTPQEKRAHHAVTNVKNTTTHRTSAEISRNAWNLTGHLTKECTKSREIAATCPHCNGDHPANYCGSFCYHYQNSIILIISILI